MRKKVAKQIGRAARSAGKGLVNNKKKVGLAAVGVALVTGAIVLAQKKKRARRARNDGAGALASEPETQADGAPESEESAMSIPVVGDADVASRSNSRSGSMTEAPVAGARFNNVRDDRKGPRVQ